MTRRTRRMLNGISIVLFCAILPSGCGTQEETEDASALTQCGVPYDQLKSFMTPLNMSGGSIRVTIDARFGQNDEFSAGSVIAALDQWNSFSQASLGYRYFDIAQGDLSGSDTTPTDDNQCDFDGGPTEFRIVREDSITTWRGLGLVGGQGNSMVPGVTARCSSGGRLTKQVVLVNTRFTDSRQFSSVVLHELGHAIGLDHSCDGSTTGTSTYRGCNGLSASHPYYIAVMYPVFRVSAPGSTGTDIKQSLRPNDMLRAKCLYHGR